MGIFQEAAVAAGDFITQPIRKALAESLTGYKFKIKRQTIFKTNLEDFIKGRQRYKVTWKLESMGKKESK